MKWGRQSCLQVGFQPDSLMPAKQNMCQLQDWYVQF
jgi:hypothetical protein